MQMWKLEIKHTMIPFSIRSTYPSADFYCVSNYLRGVRPDLEYIRYIFISSTYEDYAEEKVENNNPSWKFIKPDVVAVLNCGFIFYDSWDKSIPYLLKHPKVPLIFTEYQEQDASSNLTKVKRLCKYFWIIFILRAYLIISNLHFSIRNMAKYHSNCF